MMKKIGDEDVAQSYIITKNAMYYVVEDQQQIECMLKENVKEIEVGSFEQGKNTKSVIPKMIKSRIKVNKILQYGRV